MNTNIWSGQSVRLRPILADDWNAFHANDDDSECARLCDRLYFPRSEDGTQAWAEHQASAGPDGDKIMLAVENADGELVGSICTNNCDPRNGTFSYGLAIFRPFWRKGYASDAIRVLLRYYFEELRYVKATAHVYAFNEGSIGLHERLGFVLEGRLRDMIFTSGRHYDECLYGMTKSEYEHMKRGA